MKVDARFTEKKDGWFHGFSRRGVQVKIFATEAVEKEIAKWSGVITIEVIPELYDRYLHHKRPVEGLLYKMEKVK